MNLVFTAPNYYPTVFPRYAEESEARNSVFLAGSIEMGKAEMWQDKVIAALDGAAIFNPRRPDWETSWEQSRANPQFSEQVTWELDHLIAAENVFFYFDPNTMSPVSMMELGMMFGLAARKSDVIVVCPDGFWRKGNIDIFCDRVGATQCETLDEGIIALKEAMGA